MIKEKNELRDRERQLSEDVARLRAKLREYNSPLASRGPADDVEHIKRDNVELKQEIIKLQSQLEKQAAASTDSQHAAKHNQILKQRVRKLRCDLDDAQLKLSTSTVESQRDIERLVETIGTLKGQIDLLTQNVSDGEQKRATAEIDLAQKQTLIDKLRARIDVLERDLQQRDAVEKSAQVEVRNEMAMLCQSLDDRDRRIVDLQVALNDARQHQKEQSLAMTAAESEVMAKRVEVEALQQRITHMEGVLHDRKQYARTIGELQGRMELAVEELRRSFTPVQFAETIGNLEQRVSNLFALESQLRQKDDLIASRDDTIQQLKTHVEKVDKHMAQVSSVFMHLPRSVEEVELLMVEVDEYRRRLGMDPETQEMVQIRLLELQAKRKAGEPIPSHLDLGTGHSATGKSSAEMERLRHLTDAMSSLAASIAREDRTGLVATPAASERPPAAPPTAAAPPAVVPAAPTSSAPTAATPAAASKRPAAASAASTLPARAPTSTTRK